MSLINKDFHGYCSRGLLLSLFITCIFSFASCVGIQKHAKGIEPSARHMDSGRYEIVEPAEIEAGSFRLFWFIPVTPEMKIQEAIDDAVSRKGGDNLIDVTVWSERQYWILGTVDIIHIKGLIIRYAD